MIPLTPAERKAIADYKGAVTVCPPMAFSEGVEEKSWWEIDQARSKAYRAHIAAAVATQRIQVTHRAGSKPAIFLGRIIPVDTMIRARTWVDKEKA